MTRAAHMSKTVCGCFLLMSVGSGYLLAASTAAEPKARDQAKRLIFRGDAVANAIKGGCYGPIGIYASIDAVAPSGLSSTGVQRAARRSKPTQAQIRINGKRYRLVIDQKVSGMAYHRVWWTFKRVRISKASAQKLIGKPAMISYKVGRRTYTTKRAKVRDGDCK